MPAPITITIFGNSENNDLLQGQRLDSIPYDGVLTLEISANHATLAQHFTHTIRQPDGEVPVVNENIPANGYTEAGESLVLHDQTNLVYEMLASQGGHFQVSIGEAGTLPSGAEWVVRATLTPL